MNEPSATPGPWPAPDPVVDAPYGPRWQPPGDESDSLGPAPRRRTGTPPGWISGPLPAPEHSRARVLLFLAVSLIVTLLAGVLVARFVVREGESQAWDARVTDLVRFVEQETGKTFTRAVTIEFLTDVEFEALVTRPAAAYSDEEREALEATEATGRAMGWYNGSTDLLAQQNQLNSSGILALYRYDDRHIVARTDDPTATVLPVDLRTTLVHELVHALQDQRFTDLSKFQAAATTTEAFDAGLAVIEGHAVLVEQRYLASLPQAERDEYFEITGALTAEIDDEIEGVPPVLSVPTAVPYVYGPVLALTAEGRAGGIRGLFDTPPQATDQVLDPRGYVDGDLPEPASSLAVRPDSGATDVASTSAATAGITRLYLTLATAMAPEVAWTAANGWGNDVYLPFRDERGVQCVRWDLFADDDQAGSALGAAMETWARSREAQAQTTLGTGTAVAGTGPEPDVSVVSCDPGPDTTQPLVSDEAVDWFFTRSDILFEMTDRAGSATTAGCVTDAVMTEFPTEALAARTEPVAARLDALLATCTRSSQGS